MQHCDTHVLAFVCIPLTLCVQYKHSYTLTYIPLTLESVECNTAILMYALLCAFPWLSNQWKVRMQNSCTHFVTWVSHCYTPQKLCAFANSQKSPIKETIFCRRVCVLVVGNKEGCVIGDVCTHALLLMQHCDAHVPTFVCILLTLCVQYNIHVRLLIFRLLSSLRNATLRYSCTHFRVHSPYSLLTFRVHFSCSLLKVQRSCTHTYIPRTLVPLTLCSLTVYNSCTLTYIPLTLESE